MADALLWLVDYVKGMYGDLASDAAKEAFTLLVPIVADMMDGDGVWNEQTRAKAQGLALGTLRDAGILTGVSSDE